MFVNEIFASIQGEGYFTGTPAVFVRLQGCSVHCPWCDTKFSWKQGTEEGATVSLEDVFKKRDKPRYCMVSEETLADQIFLKYPEIPLVVITGGEPCEQKGLWDFCCQLREHGYRVQLETSGTAEIDVPWDVYVVVSPKIGMPGGRGVLQKSLCRADELKMVIGTEDDIAVLDALLENCDPERISLQPLSTGKEATDLCVRTVVERGGNYRISLQTHKYMGVR